MKQCGLQSKLFSIHWSPHRLDLSFEECWMIMVNFCVVPGCSSRSNRERHLTFHSLPLSNKCLLKQRIHQLGRKNLPINVCSRVCSRHFKDSLGRRLRSDEYPTKNFPQLATRVSTQAPRRPLLNRHTTSTVSQVTD